MLMGRIALASFALLAIAAPAFAGTIRYELPELLGEYVYDGRFSFDPHGTTDVPIDFNVYAIAETRLVIECTVLGGKAHGDGVIREAVAFDLLPAISASAGGVDSTTGIFPEPVSTDGPITYVAKFGNPFPPRVTPLLGVEHPLVYRVGVFFGTSFDTDFPPQIDPAIDFLTAFDGVIVDQPIVAQVTAAYIELSGPGIVPEPSSLVLAFAAGIGFLFLGSRRGQR